MAGVQILPKVGEQTNHEYRIVGAIVDGDVGKPVKLSGVNMVELCDDGDAIFGFINSVERGTDAGYVVVTVTTKGRVRVTASGTLTQGQIVEAAANTAAGTDIVKWGLVSTRVLDDTDAAGLIASMVTKNWVVLNTATTGVDTVVECV